MARVGRSSPSRAGARGPQGFPHMAFAGRACRILALLCRGASLCIPSLFQPEGSAWRKGCRAWRVGAGRGRRSHALGGSASARLPMEGSAGATKAERAASVAVLLWRDQRGPWELAFFATWAGGMAFNQGYLGWALPLWCLARAGRGIAWRAVQAALHPAGWQGVVVRLRCGSYRLGRLCRSAFRVGGRKNRRAEKPFSGLPARRY